MSPLKSKPELKSKLLSLFKQKRVKLCLGLILTGITVRSLPYLFPIHPQDIAQNQLAIEFGDRNGLPLGTLLSQDQNHTVIVPLQQVSPLFIQAIIAAEDKRYNHHGALDFQAITRAILEAVQAQEIVSGASTITMQLARMLDDSPHAISDKVSGKLSSKALEIWLAWRLFAGMNREEILQAYINRLPMGGNLYGVEAASRVYFGVPAIDLTLAQASLLAALPNDPTDLNPYENWEVLKQRQRYVLDRMVTDNYITNDQAERAFKQQIQLQYHRQGIITAPHFLFRVSSQLLESDPSYQDLPISQQPYIRTTLDRNLQQFVEAQVQQVLTPLIDKNVNHSAAIVIDNHTREVLAYVGSPNYFDTVNLGQNDGVQALRQPGSTLKPFLYELALEKRIIHPNTILADVPTYYAIPGAKLYTPADYSETFLGPVRVRIALANSLNIPAVRVLEKVGVSVFLDRLQYLGFQSLNQTSEHYGLGLALGSGEVNLWELAQAYVTIANQGKFQPLITTFDRTLNQSLTSKTCVNQSFCNSDSLATLSRQIDRPVTWKLITDMLSDRHARATAFGVDSVLSLPFPVAVKTGTSSDYRDTWTVGFTPDYTVATWVGNFDGAPMQKVSGVTGAAPLWSQIMLHLHRAQKARSFPPADELIQLPICDTTGLKPTHNCSSGVVLEYFYPEDITQYQNHPDEFELTAEYHEWLVEQPQTNLSNSQSKQSQLKIISPQNNDYFLVSPGEVARLEFKVISKVEDHSKQPIEWRLNNKKMASQSSNLLFQEVPVGEWILTVNQGENSDRIHFQVQVADQKSYRQGFSLNNSLNHADD
ncbi:MAG: penicillin-binding protein 1C [Microcoleaceae cyanobacterium]